MGGIIRRRKPKPPPAPKPTPRPVTTTQGGKGSKRGGMSDSDLVVEGDASSAANMRRRRRGKRALVNQPAAANVGGEGSTGLNIPTGQ